MHSGFTDVRNTYGCNFLGQYSGPIPINEKARKEIERMLTIWGDARKVTAQRLKKLGKEDEDEGFLFGKFGIADAFFWVVLWVSQVRAGGRWITLLTFTSVSGHTISLLIPPRLRHWVG
jgi:glutathione S-transferase